MRRGAWNKGGVLGRMMRGGELGLRWCTRKDEEEEGGARIKVHTRKDEEGGARIKVGVLGRMRRGELGLSLVY